MKTWIALLRGINVGGHNRLPMKELARLFEELGCTRVATYIQSGNVVFAGNPGTADSFADAISSAIEAECGFRPRVFLLSADDLASAIADNPYPQAVADPKSLHLCFLDAVPGPSSVDRLKDLVGDTESFALNGTRLYLHAPDGIGRSKFARNAEKVLGVGTTSRNWRTIMKLSEMTKVLAR